MSEHKPDLNVSQIIRDYPDCPQREMALDLLRKGHLDLAQAWLDALDDIIQHGQAKFAPSQSEVDKKSA